MTDPAQPAQIKADRLSLCHTLHMIVFALYINILLILKASQLSILRFTAQHWDLFRIRSTSLTNSHIGIQAPACDKRDLQLYHEGCPTSSSMRSDAAFNGFKSHHDVSPRPIKKASIDYDSPFRYTMLYTVPYPDSVESREGTCAEKKRRDASQSRKEKEKAVYLVSGRLYLT